MGAAVADGVGDSQEVRRSAARPGAGENRGTRGREHGVVRNLLGDEAGHVDAPGAAVVEPGPEVQARAIERLHTDTLLRRSVVQNALRKVATFAPESANQRMLTLAQQISGGDGPSGPAWNGRDSAVAGRLP